MATPTLAQLLDLDQVVQIFEVSKTSSKYVAQGMRPTYEVLYQSNQVDINVETNVNHNFFFINKDNSNSSQNSLRKQLAITSIPRDLILKRKGYNFTLNNFYGNLIDFEFEDFMNKNLIFQDFLMIAKKIKFIIIRNIPQLDDNLQNYIHRFISLIDAFYENKNILSISTRVELEKIYCGKQNAVELSRTISRLKEMGSNTYITKNLKNFVKK